MGKKLKKKNQNRGPPKELQMTVRSPKKAPHKESPDSEIDNNGVLVVKERKLCLHLDKCVDLNQVTTKIGSSEPIKCEDCREGAADRRGSKGRVKHGKKKGGSNPGDPKSDSKKAIWVCLQCGHYACGGIGLPTNPQNHAVRHVRQARHPLVIQFENPQLRWCFSCNSLIPIEKTEENGENKDVLSDLVKLIKGRLDERSTVDVETVPYENATLKTESKLESNGLSDLDSRDGYVVRGLTNLGNTCFFNSIIQNLLAMDRLRDYFLKLEVSYGPLTIALRKLFIEAITEGPMKNVINPRSLLGSVASKAPQFKGYDQHDSQELLRCLLDGLSTEELGMKKQMRSSKGEEISSNLGPTFVDEIFGGQISSMVCCVDCGHASTVFEPFLDLSLSVPTKKPLTKKVQQISRAKKTKPPPKRSGRTWTGTKKDAEILPDQSASPESVTSGLSLKEESISIGSTSVVKEKNKSEPENKAVFDNAEEQTMDSFTWLDYLGVDSVSDEHDFTSQDNNTSVVEDSENRDKIVNDNSLQNSSESNTQTHLLDMASDVKTDFSLSNSWEDEVPLQVQNSEILLLPYKEESSSSVQDDFDGLGDLFNEPETIVGPIARPPLGSEVTESTFISESDTDEVDNTDSPVSVESCLSYFTKPELLTHENGYNCERCLKILWQQRLEMKEKRSKSASKILINGHQTSNGNHSNGNSQSGIICDNMGENLASFGEKTDCSVQNHAKTVNGEASCSSCNVDDCGSIESRVPSCSSQILSGNDKSEENEDEEIDSKIINVRRDATKRFLIHRAPPILTIHIKRFRPDACGRYSKLNGHVSFREMIDLKPYMDPRCVEGLMYDYRLIGVVEHSGTMRGGHYVAYVRGSKRSKGKSEKENSDSAWYKANDSRVHGVSLDQVLRCEAYILFYERL